METKRCSRCKREQPRSEWTESQWARGVGASWSKGSGFCRPCHAAWRREWRSAKPLLRLECANERCDVIFETRSGVKRFCSTECKVASASAARSAAQRQEREDNRCAGCSKPLTHKSLGSRWCSKRCQVHSPTGIRERRARYLWKRYGITIEEYEDALERQQGLCAICKSPDPKQRIGDAWNVDHNHATGRVRGLLCTSCNTAIGHFRDNPLVVASALLYLLDDLLRSYGLPAAELREYLAAS